MPGSVVRGRYLNGFGRGNDGGFGRGFGFFGNDESLADGNVVGIHVAVLAVDHDGIPSVGAARYGERGAVIVFAENRVIRAGTAAEADVHGVDRTGGSVCGNDGIRPGIIRRRGRGGFSVHGKVVGVDKARAAVVCNAVPFAVGTVCDRDDGAVRQTLVNSVIRAWTGAEIDVVSGDFRLLREDRDGKQDTEQRRECQGPQYILSHLSVCPFCFYLEASALSSQTTATSIAS